MNLLKGYQNLLKVVTSCIAGELLRCQNREAKHSKVAGDLAYDQKVELRDSTKLNLPYFIPRECIVRSIDGESGYEPDVIVIGEPALIDEPRWESGSILTLGKSIKLIVEVVSTNWRDDYLKKMADYEALGIQEFWIIDYAALGGRRFIGNPKQPTFTVCSLVDEEYELRSFQTGQIISPTSPGLTLTVEQVFAVGQ